MLAKTVRSTVPDRHQLRTGTSTPRVAILSPSLTTRRRQVAKDAVLVSHLFPWRHSPITWRHSDVSAVDSSTSAAGAHSKLNFTSAWFRCKRLKALTCPLYSQFTTTLVYTAWRIKPAPYQAPHISQGSLATCLRCGEIFNNNIVTTHSVTAVCQSFEFCRPEHLRLPPNNVINWKVCYII